MRLLLLGYILPTLFLRVDISAESIYSSARKRNEQNCLEAVPGKEGFTRLKRECAILHFHIHKTGGVALCMAAQRAPEIRTGPHCDIPDAVRMRSDRPEDDKYAQYFAETGYQFGGTENSEFFPNLTVSNVLHLVTIRDPMDRALSAAHHFLCGTRTDWGQDALAKNFGCDGWKNVDLACDGTSVVLMDPCFEKFPYARNYYAQKFARCSYSDCSLPDLAVEQVTTALPRLDMFSAVLVTDSSETYARGRDYIYRKFGIDLDVDATHNLGTHQGISSRRALMNFPAALARLEEYTKLDRIFYDYLRLIAEEQQYSLFGPMPDTYPEDGAARSVALESPLPGSEPAFCAGFNTFFDNPMCTT